MKLHRSRFASLLHLALVLSLSIASSGFAHARQADATGSRGLRWTQTANHHADALIRYLYEASYAGGPFEQVQGVECEGLTSPFECSGILTSALRPVRVRAVDIIDTVRYESEATEEGEQTSAPPITGVVFTVYRSGQTSPATAPQSIPLSAFTCDLQTMPPPVAANPTGVGFEDPFRPGRFCHWRSPANGLFSLLAYDTAQTYVLDAAFASAAGAGPLTRSESFTNPGVPPSVAPAQLRLTAGQ